MAELTRKTWPRYVFIVLALCLVAFFVFYHLRTTSSTDKSLTTSGTITSTTIITTQAEQQQQPSQTQAVIDGSPSTLGGGGGGESSPSSQLTASAVSQSEGPTTGADQTTSGSSPALESTRADLHRDDRPSESIKPISNEIDLQSVATSASSPAPNTDPIQPKADQQQQQQQEQRQQQLQQPPSQHHSLMDTINSGINNNNDQQMSLQQPNGIADLSQGELDKWQEFKGQYRRQYQSHEEEQRRQSIFLANWRFIRSFNDLGQALYRLDINQFADYTRDEINHLFVGPQMNWNETISAQQMGTQAPKILLEDSSAPVDWRNLTGPPVDQGTCRESSVFALVASLESKLNQNLEPQQQQQQQQQQLVKLSEQQLLDCLTFNAPPPPASWPPVCQGRMSMVHVFEFLQNNNIGLAGISEYMEFKRLQAAHVAPPNTCQLPPNIPARPRLASYVQLHRDNLQEAIQNSGPVVVALDASQPTFHFYKSGLYHELACSPDTYNLHALLVGHSPAGAAGGQPEASYTVRASFGPQWGEAGFMRLLKDDSRNKCLPQNLAIYPNVALS